MSLNRSTTLWVVLLASVLLSRCTCSEELSGVPVPQIDVCVTPTPGAAEVCYETKKREQQGQGCGTEECLRPELEVDFGTVRADGGTSRIRILSAGSSDLTVQAPEVLPNSSSWFVPTDAAGHAAWKNAARVLPPGGEVSFELKLRGNRCGPQEARWKIVSNDGTTPNSFAGEQPDDPIFLNVRGFVGGPCICPQPDCGGSGNPCVMEYGSVPVGRGKIKRFDFTSCGDEPLSISETSIGRLDTVYSITTTSLPNGGVLQPGEAGSVDVEYRPLVENVEDIGALWIEGNSPATIPYLEVTLIGESTPRPSCKLGAFPPAVNFGNSTTPVQRQVRVFNEGEIACRVFDISQTSGSPEFARTAGGPPPDITLQPNDSFTFTLTYSPADNTQDTGVFRVTADDIDDFETTLDIPVNANLPIANDDGCVVQINPDTGDFGEVSIGESSTVTFTVTNVTQDDCIPLPPPLPGGCACNVQDLVLVGGSTDFRVGDGSPFSQFLGLSPDFPQSITVTFEPGGEGIKTDTLRVVTNDGIFDVPLWGNALGAKLCVDVNGGPVGTVMCGPTQPCDTVDFGAVAAGSESIRDVTLTNCGAGKLRMRGITMDPAGGLEFIKMAPVNAGAPTCTPGSTCIPFDLLPTESATLKVKYRPASGTPSFGGVNVLSSAAGSEDARLDLRGNYSGDCPRIIRCAPGVIDFGSQETGTTNVRGTVCSNFGTEELTVTGVGLTGSSELRLLSETYVDVPPGGTFSLQLECAPTTAGQKSGTLVVTSTACETSPLNLGVECAAFTPTLPECIGSSTFEPEEKWRWEGTSDFPEYDDVWMTPVVINLTDDNADGNVDVLDTPDVIFTALKSSMGFGPSSGSGDPQSSFCHANDAQPAIAVAVRGDNGQQLWSFGRLPVGDPGDPAALAFESEATLATADIDADGLPEIIGVKYTYIPPPEDCPDTDPGCCLFKKYAYGALIALEHDGTFKWESERWHLPDMTGENAGAVSLGDMDGDGFPEIAFGNAVFDHNGLLLFEGRTETQDEPGDGEGGAGHGPISVFVDLDGDGTNELVAGRTAFDADGEVIWQANIDDGLTTVANVDLDPDPEIIVLTGFNDLYVLQHTGQVLFGPHHILSGNVDENGQDEGFIATNPAVGDLDGDGYPEIVVAATNTLHVFEHDLQPKWTQAINDQTGASGPTTFDFEGDGKAEVLYADEGNVHMFSGVNGDLKYQAPRSSRTIVDNPVVADVDNDGHADILLAMESPLGGRHGVICYGNDKNNWVATRRVWNQHSYHITNISESGVVPASEGRGWIEHNVYRSNVVRCE